MKPLSCQGCPYYDRPGPVWGSGHPTATISFVTGGPIGSGASKILDNSCRRAGVNRYSQFTSSLVKCEVKKGERLDPKAVAKCRPLLDRELEGLRWLKAIVAVGESATFEFIGKKLTSVMNRKNPNVWLRGCPWPVGKSKVVIPIMSPMFYAQTGFVTGYQLDNDIQKAAKYGRGEGRFYQQHANYNPTESDIRACVEQLRRTGHGGIDIETPEDADEDELRAGGQLLPIDVIGISPAVDHVIGVQPDQFRLLEPLFTDPAHPITWYVFNGAFDFYHLGKKFGALRGVKLIWDVMLGLNRWRSDLIKKDLGIAMSFFTDMEFTKNLAKSAPIKYQWADTTGVLEAGLTMERVLEFQSLLSTLVTNDFPLLKDLTGEWKDGLSTMREIGVHADLREVFKLTKVSSEMLAKYEAVWNKHFPHVNWQASKQLFNLFTGPLKMPVIMRKRSKKLEDGSKEVKQTPTCDVEALEEYRDVYGNKTAGLILAMREMKHLGDFAGQVSPDQHIHTAYLIHRQVQFRIQAVEPNIQTLPEELGGFKTRKMVIPDNPETDELIAIDGSQCELRIYAYLAGAKALLRAMERGDYIYGAMYEQIFKRPYWGDPNQPHTKYNKAAYVAPQEILAAKSGPLGYIYGRGWKSVAEKQHIPEKEAKASHAEFHRTNPEIGELHRKIEADVKRKGYQDNLWGGRRYFLPGMRNEYLSFHGQSNWGELLRQNYLIPAFSRLPALGARVLLTVHDSMVVNCPKKHLVQCAQLLFDGAESPIPQMGGFQIPAEVKHGPNWAECKLFKTEVVNGRTVVIGA